MPTSASPAPLRRMPARREIRRLLPWLLAGLAGVALQGQPTRQGRAPAVPEYMKAYTSRTDAGNFVRAVLRNGMTVIVEEYAAQPVAAIGTWVRAGYLDETDDVAGISHVMEHMFFKGTAKRGLGQIARDTKALGGILNASTIYDHTWYYSVVPAENAARAMEIQADALQNSALDESELRKELEVIVQEGKRKLDSPAAFATEKLLELAFEKHRMRRWRIGTEEGLRALDRQKLLQFYREHYTPDRIILTVVGDVQRDRVLEKVAELYGPLQRPPKPVSASPPEPDQKNLRFAQMKGEIQRSQVVFGYHTVGVEHADYFPLLVLGEILGGGRGSIFYQQLVDRQQLVDSFDVSAMSYRGVGMFLVRCTLDPSRIERVEPAVLAEIELIRNRLPESDEMVRAATMIERSYFRGLEPAESRAGQLAFFETLGNYQARDTFVEKVRAVTGDQVRSAAQKYLRLENLSLLEYQPKSAPERSFDAAALRTTLDSLVPEFVARRRAEEEPETSEDIAPPPQSARAFVANYRRTPLKRTSVLRGPEIYYKEDHSLPLVDLALLYPGGRLEETDASQGITQLALNVAVRESDRYRDGSLALALENLGGTLTPVNAPDYYGFILSIVSRNVEAGIRLLTQVVQKPLFRPETVAKEQELQLARLKRLTEDNFSYPLQLCREALYLGHPYAFYPLGTAQSVADLDAPRLESWYRQNVVQVKPLVVLLGDIQGTQVLENMGRDFSGTRFKDKTVAERKPSDLEETRQRTESRNSKQTAIVVGFRGPSFSQKDGDVLDVIRNMVSGLGGRFFDELRDRQNLAYSVAVMTERNRFGGAVYGYIAVSPENADRAEKGLLEQFAKFITDPIRDEEYYRALVSTIGSHMIALQSRYAYIGEIARQSMLGGDMGQLDRYSDRIKAITIEDVRAAAAKYFTIEKRASGVVRAQPEPAAR